MPHLYARSVILSDNERRLLQKIARSSTNPYGLVRRVQLVLAAEVVLHSQDNHGFI
jgi:hypothetical protein